MNFCVDSLSGFSKSAWSIGLYSITLIKRTFKKGKVIVTTNFFEAPGKNIINLVEKAAEKLGYFLGHEIEMIHQ